MLTYFAYWILIEPMVALKIAQLTEQIL